MKIMYVRSNEKMTKRDALPEFRKKELELMRQPLEYWRVAVYIDLLTDR